MRLRAMGHGWRLGAVVAGIGLGGGGATGGARGARREAHRGDGVYTGAVAVLPHQYVGELPWAKVVQDRIRGGVGGPDGGRTVVGARQAAGAGPGARGLARL